MSDILLDKAKELATQMISHREKLLVELIAKLTGKPNITLSEAGDRVGQQITFGGVIYTLDGTPIIRFFQIEYEKTRTELKARQPYDILV